MNLLNQLKALQVPIKVAIVGMGAMGKGLFYQCQITPGIECVAICDLHQDRAIGCARDLQRDFRVVTSLTELHEAIRNGFLAICDDGDLTARCDLVDVLVESSSAIGAAGRFAVTALQHRTHLVLMNAEIDLLYGPYLMRLAQENGVAYTSCDGDQHGVLKRLLDDVKLWGLDLVMAGNIKGFLDRYSNPTKIVPEADKRNLDYKMATAFTDGTKLCIEMALVANALGFATLVPGMRGPSAQQVQEVFQLFDFAALWDGRQGFVDYLLGAEPGGGVFVIGHCDNAYQRRMLAYYKMGSGPFYLFYRPYHLCHVEAMACIAEAVVLGRPLLQPACGFRTNVFAYAKRDLGQGEKLDGIGGYTCYGMIDNLAGREVPAGLPICLADNITLRRPVARDQRILLADVNYDPQTFEFASYFKALEAAPVSGSA